MAVALVHRQGAKYTPDAVADPGFLLPVVRLFSVVFLQPAGIVRAAPVAAWAASGAILRAYLYHSLSPLYVRPPISPPRAKIPLQIIAPINPGSSGAPCSMAPMHRNRPNRPAAQSALHIFLMVILSFQLSSRASVGTEIMLQELNGKSFLAVLQSIPRIRPTSLQLSIAFPADRSSRNSKLSL